MRNVFGTKLGKLDFFKICGNAGALSFQCRTVPVLASRNASAESQIVGFLPHRRYRGRYGRLRFLAPPNFIFRQSFFTSNLRFLPLSVVARFLTKSAQTIQMSYSRHHAKLRQGHDLHFQSTRVDVRFYVLKTFLRD
jgi:hypothetical protein